MVKKKGQKRHYFKGAHFTATFSMSLVLFLVGTVTLVLFMAKDMSHYMRENINLSIVLKDDASVKTKKHLQRQLERAKYTKSVEFISKEQALKDYVSDLGENPEDFLGFNPLLASMEVKLKSEYANNDSIAKIEKRLKRHQSIQQVTYQKDVITMVNENIQRISLVLMGLALVLMLISFALINNTVRLAVYANRFLINTMKLVGATHWFIRKPYLLRSVVNGIVASFIALLLIGGMLYYFHIEFGMSIAILQHSSILPVSLIVLFFGITMSAVSSYFAVGRYLRMQANDMYFI